MHQRVDLRFVAAAVAAISVTSAVDAQTVQIVDNIPGVFIDISNLPPLPLGADDEIEILSTVSNVVFPSGTVVVANNGGVAYSNPPSNDLEPNNESIPSNNAFGGGQSTMAYWDEFDDKDGDVYAQDAGDRLIVQWDDRGLHGSTATFQIQVFNNPLPTGIVAQFIYVDIEQPGVDGGSSATIGYQDGGVGFNDQQWSFNTPGAVSNGTVLTMMATRAGSAPAASSVTLAALGVALLAGGAWIIRRRLHATA